MELLDKVSRKLYGGKKTYLSLYTFDGTLINTLEDVPDDCQILLVSEKENERPIGLLNNLYDFKSQQD